MDSWSGRASCTKASRVAAVGTSAKVFAVLWQEMFDDWCSVPDRLT